MSGRGVPSAMCLNVSGSFVMSVEYTLPIIRPTPAGLRLNWNYHCVDPAESPETHALAQDFRQFLLDHVSNTPAELAIQLAPGEAVAWWDDQVLHGRRAFRATATNDRFLLKSGFRLTAGA